MQEQYFNDIKFTIGPGRRYFSNSGVDPRFMHRYVWKFYNGEIPDGYDIHHKDGNRYNNDISNLECIESVEHKKLHGECLTEEEREWRRVNFQTKARPKAIEWHKSEEGREWHRKQALFRKDNRTEHVNICAQCGKEFINFANKGKKFCSGACQQKHLREARKKSGT